MKILVLGGSGQLAQEIQSQSKLQPMGHRWVFLTREKCDVRYSDQIEHAIVEVDPDIIINTTAYTAVDAAESNPQEAFLVNTMGVLELARLAHQYEAFLIHYSSDYVFDGASNLPYTETMPTNPLNVYGASKRAGELAIQTICPNAVVLRTSWVTSMYGANFTKTMMRFMREREQLRIVADQWGAPASTELLWDVTIRCIQAYIERQPMRPLYHVTASGLTTWYHYALWIRATLAARVPTLSFAAIEPIASSEYPVAATRPHLSWLDTTSFQQDFSVTLPPWQEGIEKIVSDLVASEMNV